MISAEKHALIEVAAVYGFTVTTKQIDRWRTEKLLPPAAKTSEGRGRGVRRPAPDGSAQQLMRLSRLLTEDRSLDRCAFRLWIEDYAVPLSRVRAALKRLALDPFRALDISPERASRAVEDYADSLRTRKTTPARVKKMARDGRLSKMFESIFAMGLGHATEAKTQAAFGAAFEEYAGLDRARSDHWQGGEPWLTGDTGPQMAAVARVLPALRPRLVDDATSDEFEKARTAFRSWETMRRCAELLQQQHGANVFGFGMLTSPPTAAQDGTTDPTVFVGLLAFNKVEPSFIDNVISVGETLEGSLVALREQVKNATNKTQET